MTWPRSAWTCLLSGFLVMSCSSTPTAFDERLNAAATARQRQEATLQLRHLEAAFEVAQGDDEKAEALYREAHVLLDQHPGSRGEAVLFRVALEYARSNRAARAWLDIGRLYDRQRDEGRAERCYLELLARHPSSGSAAAAARRIAQIRAERGEPAHVTYAGLRHQATDRGLQGALLYFEAVALQAIDPQGARRKLEELVLAYPLPDSPYSDEARLRLALLLRAQRQPEQALLHLKKLQTYDRSAAFVGSYTRRSYLDSYLLAAQILRDDLQQFEAAEDLIQRALKKHAQSAIVDDLYFELALVRKRRSMDACGAFSQLLVAAPDSKYRRCAPQLCPNGTSPTAQGADLSTNHCPTWMTRGSPLRTRLPND